MHAARWDDDGIRRGPPLSWGRVGGPYFRMEPEPGLALARPRPPDNPLWPVVGVCLAVIVLLVAVIVGGWQGRTTAASAWVFVENRGTQMLRVSVDGADPVAIAPGRHTTILCRPGNRYVWAESGGHFLMEGTRYLGEGSINYYMLDPNAPDGH